MNITEAYALLREHFKSHGEAAKYLGMTQQHYNALRNGRANIPQRTADYIILKAKEVQSMSAQNPQESLTQPVTP